MGVYDREYMRDLPEYSDPRQRWIVGVVLLNAALVVGWCLFGRGFSRPGFEARDFPKPKLLRTSTVDLGHFEIVSGAVAICDPGYDRQLVEGGGIAKKAQNVAIGKWRARVIHHVVDNPKHIRCGELQAFLAALPIPAAPAWEEIHPDIGVDSGQAGLFDWRHFGSDAVVPPNHPWKGKMVAPDQPWYSLCCDATLHDVQAGVIPFGAVSSSGWGDGGYPAYAIRDDQGAIVGLRLMFISRDEYDLTELEKPGPNADIEKRD